MTTLYQPAVVLPYLAINSIFISNNVVTPNTQIDVTSGICRDSTNIFDLNLGNHGGVIEFQDANVTTTIDATLNGINGLDQGSLAASTLYYIYVVADTFTSNPTGLVLSLNTPDVGPLMPEGYDKIRLVGAQSTDSSSHFRLVNWTGNQNYRTCLYRTPVITAIAAGTDNTYTNISLSPWVPKIDNLPVWIYARFFSGTAGRIGQLAPPSPGASTEFEAQITTQVVTVPTTATVRITSKLATISSVVVPAIAYISPNGGDTMAVYVSGFDLFV